jgi:uncharacterized protein (TIGR02266 family)
MADEKGRRTTGSMPVFSGNSPAKPGASSSALPRVEIPREASSRISMSSSGLPRMDASRDASSRLGTSSTGLPRIEIPRDARIPLAAQVRLQYASILDFHESQSVNISRSGMFVASESPASVGTLLDFEFCLDDGLVLLKGKGEVVRVTQSPAPGMGVRFRELDEESRKCIVRIVEINEQEGRAPSVPLDFDESRPVATRPSDSRSAMTPVPRASHTLHGATRVQPGLSVVGLDLQVRLTPLTAGYFTNNPLINIRLGGFVIPIDEEVPLGSFFDVKISDNDGISLFSGRGKVVAKHEHRIGVRLADTDRTTLERLQAEVAKLGPGRR